MITLLFAAIFVSFVMLIMKVNPHHLESWEETLLVFGLWGSLSGIVLSILYFLAWGCA